MSLIDRVVAWLQPQRPSGPVPNGPFTFKPKRGRYRPELDPALLGIPARLIAQQEAEIFLRKYEIGPARDIRFTQLKDFDAHPDGGSIYDAMVRNRRQG